MRNTVGGQCAKACAPSECEQCAVDHARVGLEQEYRRREAMIATRAYFRALGVYLVESVRLVRATAEWLWWEARH